MKIKRISSFGNVSIVYLGLGLWVYKDDSLFHKISEEQ